MDSGGPGGTDPDARPGRGPAGLRVELRDAEASLCPGGIHFSTPRTQTPVEKTGTQHDWGSGGVVERGTAPNPGSWARPGRRAHVEGDGAAWSWRLGCRMGGAMPDASREKHWGVFVRQGAICWTQNQEAHTRSRMARNASRHQPALAAWISG